MASPRTRGVNSMESFATKLTSYKNLQSATQVRQLQEADKRFQRELIRASRRAAGSDRVLSGVGRAVGFGKRKGAPLGYSRTREGRMAIKFTKTGPWQFVDSTISSGPTNPHTISVNTKDNPRPLTPAKRLQPSLRRRAAPVKSGFFGPPGTGVVSHPGSIREPFWGQAVSRAAVVQSYVMAQEFIKVGRSVWP